MFIKEIDLKTVSDTNSSLQRKTHYIQSKFSRNRPVVTKSDFGVAAVCERLDLSRQRGMDV